jgi:uncharacterized protein (DUF2141 family)
MKLFATIIAFVFALQFSTKTIEEVKLDKRTIIVTVPNVTSNKGKVSYALYNKENFSVKPLQAKSTLIKDKKSTVIFTDVAPGEYAIICFHDANGNGKMDFQPSGMPMEEYGISNNPTSFGPPNYETAKFIISDKDVTLEIRF